MVVSETGLVYTFTTPKLQPLVTKAEGKNLIQVRNVPVASGRCLASPKRALTRRILTRFHPLGLPERSRADTRQRKRRRRWRPGRITRGADQPAHPSRCSTWHASTASHARKLHAQHAHGPPTGPRVPELRATKSGLRLWHPSPAGHASKQPPPIVKRYKAKNNPLVSIPDAPCSLGAPPLVSGVR